MAGKRTVQIVSFCLISIAALCGCEKQETAAVPPPPPPPPPSVMETPKVVIAEPPPPPPKTTEEIVGEFLQVPARERTDESLVTFVEHGDGLRHITELDLSGSAITEKGIRAAAAFSDLRSLNLSGCQISNDALRGLEKFPKLEVLNLSQTSVDSGGMVHVGKILTLRELNLAKTAITGAGFVWLKDLKNLEVLRVDDNRNLSGREFSRLIEEGAFPSLFELSVSETQLPTNGADRLNRLPNLRIFRAQNAGIDDDVIRDLSRCSTLLVLDIANNPISLSAIRRLAKLTNLEELNLSGCTNITDIAFNTLKSAKTLKRLDVSNTGCTQQAVELLAGRFLPDTEIVFNGNSY